MIKKFKNGKVKLQCNKTELDENFYHDEMFFNNLSINQINGYLYLIDTNKQLVYEIDPYLMHDPISYIIETIKSDGRLYLQPLNKKESKSLLEDLENGY